MIENLRTALVTVVLIGGMVAFLAGSAHAWPWDSVGGYGAAGQEGFSHETEKSQVGVADRVRG
jgi:hypothetical protein